MGMKPRLTLCLIAKDEEAMLPDCLASVRGVVDEIVLVDTGSTDRTRELARAAGAIVLERPWDDDFAAPRNLAARHATGDWLLVLDADERLGPGAGKRLRAALKRSGFDLGMIRLHNATRRTASPEAVVGGPERIGQPIVLPRLVRNVDQPEWRGAIHESVGDWLLRRRGRRVLLDVDVVHLGYLPSVAQARDKQARNIALLKKRLELAPEDITPAGYLALELMESGRNEEAAGVVAAAWAILDRQPAHRCFHRLGVARGLQALQRADGPAALETAEVVAAHNGPHPDFDYLRGFAQEILAVRSTPRTPERGALLRDAAEAFEAALRRLASDGPFEFLGLVNLPRAHLHLGVVRLLAGDPGAALRSFAEALRLEPANPSALVCTAEALVEAGNPGKALAVVEKAMGDRPDAWLIAAAAAERLGARDDARLFLGKARERTARGGYECLHRSARHEALERALAG